MLAYVLQYVVSSAVDPDHANVAPTVHWRTGLAQILRHSFEVPPPAVFLLLDSPFPSPHFALKSAGGAARAARMEHGYTYPAQVAKSGLDSHTFATAQPSVQACLSLAGHTLPPEGFVHVSRRSADAATGATGAALHTVSVVVVQVVLTPFVHVSTAAHALQGAVPAADQVAPALQAAAAGAALHTVSVVVVQAVFTALVHVASAAQVVQGVLPEAEKVVPAAHAVAPAEGAT